MLRSYPYLLQSSESKRQVSHPYSRVRKSRKGVTSANRNDRLRPLFSVWPPVIPFWTPLLTPLFYFDPGVLFDFGEGLVFEVDGAGDFGFCCTVGFEGDVVDGAEVFLSDVTDCGNFEALAGDAETLAGFDVAWEVDVCDEDTVVFDFGHDISVGEYEEEFFSEEAVDSLADIGDFGFELCWHIGSLLFI